MNAEQICKKYVTDRCSGKKRKQDPDCEDKYALEFLCKECVMEAMRRGITSVDEALEICVKTECITEYESDFCLEEKYFFKQEEEPEHELVVWV